MDQMDDMALVKAYADTASEAAFEALVSRHLNFVFSTALRQVRDAALAEDISQAVFIILARKAKSMRPDTILPAWLYRTTRYASADALDAEARRRRRESEAHKDQPQTTDGDDSTWRLVAPLLDDALATLGEKDRNAIILRYLEGRNLREVGLALGAGENAAGMRISRALEKLRRFFARRGVALPATAIAAVVSAYSLQAAPAGLAASITSASLAQAGAGGTLFAALLKAGTLTKIAAGLAGAAVIVGLGTSALAKRQALRELRAENASLQARFGELAQTAEENRRSANLSAQAGNAPSNTVEQGRELLRLRAEVARLRRENRELAGLRLAQGANPTPPNTTSPPDVPPQDIFPKASWAFAGFATPEATLQSFHWANLQGDFKTLANCQADPSEQARVEEREALQYAGMSQAEIAAEIAKRMSVYEGYRIVDRTNYPSGEVEIAYYYDGPDIYRGLRLKKVGEEWKIAPGQR